MSAKTPAMWGLDILVPCRNAKSSPFAPMDGSGVVAANISTPGAVMSGLIMSGAKTPFGPRDLFSQ